VQHVVVVRVLFLATSLACSSAESPPLGDASTDNEAAQAQDVTPPAPMWITANGSTLMRNGAPLDFRGAISCCGGGYGWPLFDETWVDYLAPNKVNFLHVRLGPFLTTTQNGETDWATTGGGYVEANGKADLSQFNAKFWTRVHTLVTYAHDHGMNVEVDVADGWAIKHCVWGDIPGYSAWDAAFNVQAEDDCTKAANAPVAAGSIHDQWIRKVIQETGGFDNVVYQDGNEIGLVTGYTSAWTTSMQAIVRDEEAKNKFGHHLFGTNSGDATAMQSAEVEYVEMHQTAPLASPSFGKPSLVNEYNPTPALTAAQSKANYCTARANGTYYWYWRHDQTQDVMDAALASIAAGCP
jgi:hypothetical protein